jgi:glutamine synthetase
MGGYPPARFYGSDDGDLALVAEPSMIHPLPWSDEPRALAICDADELSGESSNLSTRGQLKAVIARYAARGLAPVVATELEFFVFAPNTDPTQPFRPPVGLDGRREDGHSAFSVSSNNGLRPFFSEVYKCMAALGLPRDTFMHEMGVSQFEINLLHGDPLLLADQTFLFKHLLKEVALKHGLTVVCMAKPLAHTPGSSMHIHQSLVEIATGRNVFSDEQASDDGLSAFHRWPAGLHGRFHRAVRAERELLSASCATLCFAEQCLLVPRQPRRRLRIPASSPVARRVENRLPGADANPYLAIAASLAAGLHGIEQSWSRARRSRANSKCRHLSLPYLACRARASET